MFKQPQPIKPQPGQESVWDYLRLPRLEPTTKQIQAAWTYPHSTSGFAAMKDYEAFYTQPMDRYTVDGELVKPQPGDFYSGWITHDVVGPFKGEPGSMSW